MLERLIHEPLAKETGQPLLVLSSFNKQLALILIFFYLYITEKTEIKGKCVLSKCMMAKVVDAFD